ncbi:MAG: hypothetical protein ABFC84_06930 [Veillonellales bacterium]
MTNLEASRDVVSSILSSPAASEYASVWIISGRSFFVFCSGSPGKAGISLLLANYVKEKGEWQLHVID